MIAIVVPTIREEQIKQFRQNWEHLIEKHKVILIEVHDGDEPFVLCGGTKFFPEEIMGGDKDLIYNFNDGVRNLGFACAAKIGADYIISLDDDVKPYGDTIQDHLDVLNRRWPISWFSHTEQDYMRGFPYNIRDEAECWVSHGVWYGVPDMDGISQLKDGVIKPSFYEGPVPKGALMPFCAMNFAFKKEALPYIYQAPMFNNINRFADIWGGIELKKDLDKLGKAMVTGIAWVHHDRASNVYKNIQKEALGIEMNDFYGEHHYFNEVFFPQRERWKKFILGLDLVKNEKWNCNIN